MDRVTHNEVVSQDAVSSQPHCLPTSEGCMRCQSVPMAPCSTGASLLLGPQNADVKATLLQALDEVLKQVELSYFSIGPLMVIPNIQDRLGTITALLGQHLTPFSQLSIRAVYTPMAIRTQEEGLHALLYAESLETVINSSKHEWVREALAKEWLFSVFHPIVDARSGTVFAHEALVRARDPQQDQVMGAGQIIEACEALNLQHQLDQQARRVAIRGAARWVDSRSTIFINFMPNTIYDPAICLRTTMEAAEEYRISPSRLVFEVVESEKIPNMNRLCNILNYYRERGIQTAVDDMGAGFTCKEYLTTLRPNYVKLDRQLIVEAEHDARQRQKLATIVQTAHELGIRTVAEGIETTAQLEMCLQEQLDYLQGYLFAHPAVPPQSVTFSMLDSAA